MITVVWLSKDSCAVHLVLVVPKEKG